MVKAIFAGSFDPPTNGHLDIIQRACKLFDIVDVVIAVNPQKKYLFSEEERLAFLKDLLKNIKNVEVHTCSGLIVKYAEKVGAKTLIRGIRSTNDFGYEFEIAMMNQSINKDIETIFIPTKEEYAIIKSSSIKELAQFGGNIEKMVPKIVENEVYKKYNNVEKWF